MKSKFVLRIAFLGLILAGLSFTGSMGHLSAQSGTSENFLYSEPDGSFVSTQEASLRIDNAIAPLKVQLEYMLPGSPQYKEVNAQYTYMVAVQNLFVNGMTVSKAIAEGLKEIAAPDAFGISEKTLLTYKQQLIALLKV